MSSTSFPSRKSRVLSRSCQPHRKSSMLRAVQTSETTLKHIFPNVCYPAMAGGNKVCSLIWRCKAIMQRHMEGDGNTKSLLQTPNRFNSLFSRCQLTEPIEIVSISEQHEVFKTSFPHTHRFTYCFSFDGIFFKARVLTLADHPARPPRFHIPRFFSDQLLICVPRCFTFRKRNIRVH